MEDYKGRKFGYETADGLEFSEQEAVKKLWEKFLKEERNNSGS